MPTVSVVIPTYKHASVIRETLASVFAQTYQDFEIIVINDGSPDDTAQVLAPFVRDGRVRYFEQSNQGQAATRNRGITEAKGTYTALLDDDDLWPPEKLAMQVAALERHPQAVMAYGSVTLFDTQGNRRLENRDSPGGDALAPFLLHNWIYSPGQTLIRTASLRDIGGFDVTIWGADDWDLFIRLAMKGPFVFQPYETLQYRLHEQNASRNLVRMYKNCNKVRYKHLGRFPTLGNYSMWIQSKKFIRNYLFDLGFSMLGKSSPTQRLERLHVYSQLVRINPFCVRHSHIRKGIGRAFWCKA